MTIYLISFLAGILTVLAPCVLPLLPIILGASIENKDRKRPYIIIGSLVVSIMFFSIILKGTTILIGFNQKILTNISGIIIILFGVITIFPNIWKKISGKIGLDSKSNNLLGKSSQKSGILGNVLIGFSLGPVFTSCSPTYAIILAVILPVSFFSGFINLLIYSLGLAIVLLFISILGQKFSSKLKYISDPNSIFKKVLGIIFLIIGFFILTGIDKKIEANLIKKGFVGFGNFEQKLLDGLEEKNGGNQNNFSKNEKKK